MYFINDSSASTCLTSDLDDESPCSKYKSTPAEADFEIFCDLDGVLVDFESGVQKVLNRPTKRIEKNLMWHGIENNADSFFEHLPWAKDGQKLWHAIMHKNPDILTGVPSYESSRIEKFKWCLRELGGRGPAVELHHVDMAAQNYRDHASVNGNVRKEGACNIITCWSWNKHFESHPRAILIDDRISLKETWEAAGGIFIHHTNTETTLQKLRECGALADGDLAILDDPNIC